MKEANKCQEELLFQRFVDIGNGLVDLDPELHPRKITMGEILEMADDVESVIAPPGFSVEDVWDKAEYMLIYETISGSYTFTDIVVFTAQGGVDPDTMWCVHFEFTEERHLFLKDIVTAINPKEAL